MDLNEKQFVNSLPQNVQCNPKAWLAIPFNLKMINIGVSLQHLYGLVLVTHMVAHLGYIKLIVRKEKLCTSWFSSEFKIELTMTDHGIR